MISLKSGKPVAIVKDGKYKGELVRIETNEAKIIPDKKSITIQDGTLSIVPDINTREILYIAGPSGSGKSTLASSYIENYRALYPENDVYIFSRVGSDSCIDKLNKFGPDGKGGKEIKITRVPLDDMIKDIDIATDLKNSLVLFDDCDTLQDKKIKDALSKIKNDILETGRHYNIYCVITSHLINSNEKKDTRVILNECHSLCIFPKCGSTYQIIYALKTYFGLNKKQIEKILNLPSRWVMLNKSYPQYVLYDKGCYIT